MMERSKKNPHREKKKILFIESTAEMVGGGQQSLLGLLRSLDRQAVTPSVVFPSSGPLSDTVRSLDIPVFFVPMKSFRPTHLTWNIRSMVRLARIIRKEKIDLIHTNASRTALYAGLVSRILRVPMVWHVRIALRDRWLDPFLLVLATRVIAISQAVSRRFHFFFGRGKVKVVYNGLDFATFTGSENQELRKKYGLQGKILVGIVGQLHPLKGHSYLFHALERVIAQHPDVHCVVVGEENAYQKELERNVEALGISQHVTFGGYCGDVAEVMSSIDILALPTLTEGFGRVLIEAMACEKPVVAFEVDAVPEVVEEGVTGFLVPRGDVEGLAQAILKLAGDPILREEMGQRGRGRVQRYFGLEDHVRKVEQLYEEVLAS